MSKQKYYSEPYAKRFESEVEEVIELKNGWGTRLSGTIFYPEGGGQPGDRGLIGKTVITDTRKIDGKILHLSSEKPEYKIGAQVETVLDWEHRYDYMQQHTGQHILSGALFRECGIGTVSVHQGEAYVTIETDRSSISQEEIDTAERAANEAVLANVPVSAKRVGEEEARQLPLRRAPKVSGMIRLVSVGEYDLVACAGIHTASSDEVKLVAWIGSEKIRGHVRLYWKIGDRALQDYRSKTLICQQLTDLFSVPTEEIAAHAQMRLSQIRDLTQETAHLENRYLKLKMELLARDAEILGNTRCIIGDFSQEFSSFFKLAAKNLPAGENLLLFCGVQRREGGDLRWMIAETGGEGIDFNRIRGELFPIIEAKGGGRSPVWQGKGERPEGAAEFLDAFRKLAAQVNGE